jgi:hypothetical protein
MKASEQIKREILQYLEVETSLMRINNNLTEITHQSSGDTTIFDPPEKLHAQEEKNYRHIAAWEALIQEGNLSSADKVAASLAIEKWRGKTHKECYVAVFPNKRIASPVECVSKKQHRVKKLSEKHELPMPKWSSNL